MTGCVPNPGSSRPTLPLVLAAALCLPGILSAQEPESDDARVTIMGVVYDVVTGNAIPTAAISLENGRQGVLTDDQASSGWRMSRPDPNCSSSPSSDTRRGRSPPPSPQSRAG